MTVNLPWTHQELAALRARLHAEIGDIEREFDGAPRPLPPMTCEEVEGLMFGLFDVAERRPLARDETFLLGQLLNVFRAAVRAEMLGKKGRYFVIPESQVQALVEQQRKDGAT